MSAVITRYHLFALTLALATLASAARTIDVAAIAASNKVPIFKRRQLPSPSCMLNNESCPIPRGWEADWSVLNSSAMMAAAESDGGFKPVHKWGYVTLDWQAGMLSWLQRPPGSTAPTDPAKTTCEATSAANCAALKAAGAVKRCGIYHNMELALQWLESNRAVMDDAHIKAGWFLTHPNGTVLNTPRTYPHNTTSPLLSQYFIDWRNADAAAYFVGAIVNSTFLDGVDATFTDDLPGFPQEADPSVVPASGLSNHSLAELQFATQESEGFVATTLAIEGKFCWDCVGGEDGPEGSSYGFEQVPPPNNTAGCDAWFRHYCAPEMQGRGMFMDFPANNPRASQALGAFLVTRGPYAFIGGRGLRDDTWHPIFATDVGEPLGLCYEAKPHVFERKWSKGVAGFDCSTYTAHLPFPSLPLSEVMVSVS